MIVSFRNAVEGTDGIREFGKRKVSSSAKSDFFPVGYFSHLIVNVIVNHLHSASQRKLMHSHCLIG